MFVGYIQRIFNFVRGIFLIVSFGARRNKHHFIHFRARARREGSQAHLATPQRLFIFVFFDSGPNEQTDVKERGNQNN